MLRLEKELKRIRGEKGGNTNNEKSGSESGAPESKKTKLLPVRDRLVLKELHELQGILPSTSELKHEDPDKLYDFRVIIQPNEGLWKGGKFVFHVVCTEEYNTVPPTVKCETRLWHPNINEEGSICLSLLRQHAAVKDGADWNPTRGLKDVVFGLNSLFTDLLNFDDPLNCEAASMYQKDPKAFQKTVQDYIAKYSKSKL